MNKKIRLWIAEHRGFIYTVQYIFVGLLLLLFVWRVDMGYSTLEYYIPEFFFTKVSLARSLLTTLAGTFLTIATFNFETIMSVLDQFSASYTYRSMENFTNQPTPMKILGVYVGGFFYCVAALIIIRYAAEERLVIAGTVSIIYAIASLGIFIRFIMTVIRAMQTENLYMDIYKDSLPAIETEIENREKSKEYTRKEGHYEFDVFPENTGYFAALDEDLVVKVLEDYEGTFFLFARIGDYLSDAVPAATVYLAKEPEDAEELKERLAPVFLTAQTKTQASDYRYGITKLVESAVRGLEEHNDPETATKALHPISLLLARLASTDKYHILAGSGENTQIYYRSYPLDEDLYFTLQPILHYGADDAGVMRTVLECLAIIHQASAEENKKKTAEFADYVKDICDEHFDSPLDRDYLAGVNYEF